MLTFQCNIQLFVCMCVCQWVNQLGILLNWITIMIWFRWAHQRGVKRRKVISIRRSSSRSNFVDADFSSSQRSRWNYRTSPFHVLIRTPSLEALFLFYYIAFLYQSEPKFKNENIGENQHWKPMKLEFYLRARPPPF